MPVVILLLSTLTNLLYAPASRADNTVATQPQSTTISYPGRFAGSYAHIAEDDGGAFRIFVQTKFHNGRHVAVSHRTQFAFSNPGWQVVRDANRLYLVGRQNTVLLAERKWWYSIWLPAQGVQLSHRVERLRNSNGAWPRYSVSVRLKVDAVGEQNLNEEAATIDYHTREDGHEQNQSY